MKTPTLDVSIQDEPLRRTTTLRQTELLCTVYYGHNREARAFVSIPITHGDNLIKWTPTISSPH